MNPTAELRTPPPTAYVREHMTPDQREKVNRLLDAGEPVYCHVGVEGEVYVLSQAEQDEVDPPDLGPGAPVPSIMGAGPFRGRRGPRKAEEAALYRPDAPPATNRKMRRADKANARRAR
ncbi:hypothetical protein [Paludisphaera mucosa]|uniref:Uncharacterized protein n=1 Tax=Paludisphaera mucosa TaxID=3030827 RepID=A0ABT6F6L5_9BACT|nr:hypothetical protein [Paludisphaera mucosa]MDG3003232.1 hypothetical protein [Paludisphaera mucosa]